MIPFVKAIVPVVDIKNGTITVTPPLGLFEEIEDDGAETSGPARVSQASDN